MDTEWTLHVETETVQTEKKTETETEKEKNVWSFGRPSHGMLLGNLGIEELRQFLVGDLTGWRQMCCSTPLLLLLLCWR